MRFIEACNGDVEEAQKLIELSYTFRSKHPDLFLNRDPLDPKTQKAFNNSYIVSYPHNHLQF